jgi:hypothetical protein
MQQLRFSFAMALLYMFRVTISPIIRSTKLYMATGELAHCIANKKRNCCILLDLRISPLSAQHVSGDKFAHPQEHFLTVGNQLSYT